MSVNKNDTELWLVQLPHKFDVSALSNLDTSVFGLKPCTQTLKVKTEQAKMKYLVRASKEHNSDQKLFTVVTDAEGQASVGKEVVNVLRVTETVSSKKEDVDTVDGPLPPQEVGKEEMFSAMKPRFTLYGTDIPTPSHTGKAKKKKKRSSRGEEPTEQEVIQEMKSPSKKGKQEASSSICQEPEADKRDEEESHQDRRKSGKKKHKATPNHSEQPDVEEREEESHQERRKSGKKRKHEVSMDHSQQPEVEEKEEEIHKERRKSGKKRKHEATPDHSEQVEMRDDGCVDVKKSGKKRKREASPDPGEEPEKKKKKSKHRHSEPVALHNGDGDHRLASPKKHKRRKSEGAVMEEG